MAGSSKGEAENSFGASERDNKAQMDEHLNVSVETAVASKKKEMTPEEIFERVFSMEKYRSRLGSLALDKKRSIEVSILDIAMHSENLANLILEQPDEYIKYAENSALNKLYIEGPGYASELAKDPEGLRVRLKDLPMTTPMRLLDSRCIGKMVAVKGIVVRASILKPLLLKAVFECRRCGEVMVVEQEGQRLRKPYACANPDCKSRQFKLLEDESVFIDSQELRIQEPLEEMPPGQIPRQITVRVTISDIIGAARPGDHVTVNGIVRAEPAGRDTRTYIMYLEANNIEVRRIEEELELDDEERDEIRRIAEDPDVIEKIVQSIAPSIYGHEEIKKAILCLLFGGVSKDYGDIKVRGDPNVLLIGDPGTAKSQLLLAATRLAPRGIYTSGRGTSTAGLTAAVIFEEGGANLEAGALVLADRGIACIDELEKMRPEDRSSIHEALEQRTVSIAKGGIVARLNARCGVLAAANPTFGRYDDYRTAVENINLPPTLLSRFDLIFVLKDRPSEDKDASLARHILNLHQMGEKGAKPPIERNLLRKYIAYARRNCNPKITDKAKEKLFDFYLEMRKSSGGENSPIAITPRQLESLIRLSEAFARAALKKEVTEKEAEMAIQLMKSSIRQVGIDLETGRIDIDLMMTGKPRSLREKMKAVLDAIREVEDEKEDASLEDIVEQLEGTGMDRDEIERVIQLLRRDGQLIEPRRGRYKIARV